jgi:hypothetical protein
MSVHSRTLLRIESFAAVREVFSNVYPDKKLPNIPTGNKFSEHWKFLRQETCPASESFERWHAPLHRDGATATLRTQLLFCKSSFCERIVGRGIWPPRSPDLTPPDFFLSWFLKERVHSNNPRSLEKLKRGIEQECGGSGESCSCQVVRKLF